MYLGHHIRTIDDQRLILGHAQRHMQDRPILGDVDVLACEHGVAPGQDAPLLGQPDQSVDDCLIQPLAGVVQSHSSTLGDHAKST